LIGSAGTPAEHRAAGGRKTQAIREPGAGGTGSSAACDGAQLEDLQVTLVDEHRRTQPLIPRPARRRMSFSDDCARGIVEALDEIVREPGNPPARLSAWQGTREVLLGDTRGGLASPSPTTRPGPAGAGGAGEMALGQVFRGWWEARPAALCREDGL